MKKPGLSPALIFLNKERLRKFLSFEFVSPIVDAISYGLLILVSLFPTKGFHLIAIAGIEFLISWTKKLWI